MANLGKRLPVTQVSSQSTKVHVLERSVGTASSASAASAVRAGLLLRPTAGSFDVNNLYESNRAKSSSSSASTSKAGSGKQPLSVARDVHQYRMVM